MKSPPGRARYPEDENRLSWLPPLLEIQPLTDQGVAAAMRADGRRLVESGEVHRLAQSLRQIRWENLAAHMAAAS